MSINLIFRDGRAVVDFPYQTSTNISKAVMAATTNEEKLKIIKEDLKKFGDSDYWFRTIEEMLDSGWKIDMI